MLWLPDVGFYSFCLRWQTFSWDMMTSWGQCQYMGGDPKQSSQAFAPGLFWAVLKGFPLSPRLRITGKTRPVGYPPNTANHCRFSTDRRACDLMVSRFKSHFTPKNNQKWKFSCHLLTLMSFSFFKFIVGTQWFCERTPMFCKWTQSFSRECNTFAIKCKSIFPPISFFSPHVLLIGLDIYVWFVNESFFLMNWFINKSRWFIHKSNWSDLRPKV